MELRALIATTLAWAVTHPYLTFALLLGLLILYSKFIYPKEWKL